MFIVELPAGPLPAVVAPGWRGDTPTLEDLVFTYLKTSAAPRETEAMVVA